MYDNEYFVVDLANCTSTGEIINNISLELEALNHSGKRIVLKLNDSYLNQSQLLSIQSLITSWGCILDTIETTNQDTWTVAENMNILVQKPIEKRLEENLGVDSGITLSDSFSYNTDNAISIIDVNATKDNSNSAVSTVNETCSDKKVDNNILYNETELKNNIRDINESVSNSDVAFNSQFKADDKVFSNSTDSISQSKEDVNNSIGVYKKAYDTLGNNSDWENIDFYESPTDEPVVSDTKTTTYINQTLRSGQVLESEGNVVIIGDCHSGSEIRAVGDITVWGVLSGIAHAGYKGNENARIRALKMNAVQLRIASCYSRRPDTTNIPYIIRSSVFTPEEARIEADDIVLFKINQN